MKILWYTKSEINFMSQWHDCQDYDELKRHGVILDFFDGRKFDNPDQANDALVMRIKKTRDYNLFISAYAEKDVYIESLKEIKRLGIPTLLICYDNLLYPYRHKTVSIHYDLVWLTSVETKYLFDRWGATSIFLPYAANPYNIYKTDYNEIQNVVFIGTPYGSRANTINKLISGGIPVSLFTGMYQSTRADLYEDKEFIENKEEDVVEVNKEIVKNSNKTFAGKDFFKAAFDDIRFPIGRKIMWSAGVQKIKKQEGVDIHNPLLTIYAPLSFQNMYRVHHIAGLDLSSTSARNTGIMKHPVDVINLRNFEIPMSGGIEFCRYNQELSNYFEDEKEIIFYRDDEEMIDKAQYYLAMDRTEVRRKIREAARKRAESEHTWYNRFKRVFEMLGAKI